MSELKDKLSTLRIDGSARGRRRRIRLPILIVLIGAAATGTWLFSGGVVAVTTVQPTVITVEQLAQGQPILTASGYLVPRRRAIVSSKIQGRLAELRVEEGSRVAAGEVIARLESNDFEAQVRRAEAGIARTRAAITRSEADLLEQRRLLRKAQELSRDKVLPVNDQEAAAARVELAEASVKQAHAELRVSEADRELALANLRNTVIVAPFAGTVVRKQAEVGESVAPIPPGVNISTASGAIVALADLETLEVEVDVAESTVARLGPDQPAEVTIEAFPKQRFKGVLRQVIPSADRTRATVLVKVTLLEKDPALKPEMSARVNFLESASEAKLIASRGQLITVPPDAIVTREGATLVFAVADGRAKPITITAGDERREGRIVTAGLRGDETLIVAPNDAIEAGTRVKVQ